MVKHAAWAYLEAAVSRRNSIEFKKTIGGGYFVSIGGFYLGTGNTCKAAMIGAVKDSKRRRSRNGP